MNNRPIFLIMQPLVLAVIALKYQQQQLKE
jgi:hypothetical protein